MLMESLLRSASAIGQGIGFDNEKGEANGKEEIKVVENLKRRVKLYARPTSTRRHICRWMWYILGTILTYFFCAKYSTYDSIIALINTNRKALIMEDEGLFKKNNGRWWKVKYNATTRCVHKKKAEIEKRGYNITSDSTRKRLNYIEIARPHYLKWNPKRPTESPGKPKSRDMLIYPDLWTICNFLYVIDRRPPWLNKP